MPLFKLDCVDNKDVYETAKSQALSSIADKSIPFIYSDKHEFLLPKKVVAPLFIFEKSGIDTKLMGEMKKKAKGTLSEGFCYRNKEQVVVLRVAKGSITESSFKVAGISKCMIAKKDGPIASDANVGDNPISIEASKLEQFEDIVKRQTAKRKAAQDRLTELDVKKKEATEAVKKLKAETPENKLKPEWKLALESAEKVGVSISQESSPLRKVIGFADDILKKTAAAKTDKEKADAVFAAGKFGDALTELEGSAYKAMMETNDAIMVLGRTSDTWSLQMTDQEKPRALVVDPTKYSLTANDAFMKAGLDIKARFQLVSDFQPATVEFLKKPGLTKVKFLEFVNKVKAAEPGLWNAQSNSPAVSAREFGQLLDDGYWFGLFPDPKNKGKNIQMMFPKALKPDVLEGIRNFNKANLKPVSGKTS